MIPNDPEVTEVFGPPKRGVLNAFKNSARNCTTTRSTGLKSLNSDRSKFRTPSVRTSGSRAPRFPNVNGAGWLKTACSKYDAPARCSDGPVRGLVRLSVGEIELVGELGSLRIRLRIVFERVHRHRIEARNRNLVVREGIADESARGIGARGKRIEDAAGKRLEW